MSELSIFERFELSLLYSDISSISEFSIDSVFELSKVVVSLLSAFLMAEFSTFCLLFVESSVFEPSILLEILEFIWLL